MRTASILTATLLLSASTLASPHPALAHCSLAAVAKIAERIRAAANDIGDLPTVAQVELDSTLDDLHSCYDTARADAEKWAIVVLREQAAIEIAAAVANEGHFSRSRALIRATRERLADLASRANGNRRATVMLARLRVEAMGVDDLAHRAQRIISMKVAGDHVFDEGTASVPKAGQPVSTRRPRAMISAPLSCARPNVPATTLHAIEPDTPAVAQQHGISGQVQVIVALDEQSHVLSTSIGSSPSAVLNQAALQAAQQSTFRTEIRDCKPIASRYLFTVDFSSQ